MRAPGGALAVACIKPLSVDDRQGLCRGEARIEPVHLPRCLKNVLLSYAIRQSRFVAVVTLVWISENVSSLTCFG